MSETNPYATIKVSPDPGFDLQFDGIKIDDLLGRPYMITLDVSSGKAKGDLVPLLGSSVTTVFQQSDAAKTKRYFNGILTRIVYAGLTGGSHRYIIELRPWIWLLSRVQDCKIFQNMTAIAIIKKVFSDAGFSDVADKRQNDAGSATLEFCVQYRETSLDFVTRLMEQFGIYYFFTHDETKHTLNLADDSNSHTALSDAIPYHPDLTESRTVDDHIWAFYAEADLQPHSFTYRDYNFTMPSADLTAKSLKPANAQFPNLEVYDYPGPYDTAENGQKLADVRMQDLAARQASVGGSTNARGLQTGTRFTMSGFTADDSVNKEYLITGTSVTLAMGESKTSTDGDLTDTYRCTFTAILQTVPFRLDARTKRPMIRGPQTAKVVGASGDEITTDQYGRVKVKFYWDRVNPDDDTASCWIRVSQHAAGQGFGGMNIPRVGEEVIVEFLEGNPDRPIVTGRVYNAKVTPPATLPDNKTQSTIKSNSSKGGGGFNELRFEDKKGSEEVFLQAQKDFTRIVVDGDDKHTVQKGDHTTTIDKGKHTTTVTTGDMTTTVSQGKHETTISAGDHVLTVSAGSHKITVSAGASTMSAAQSIKLTVGGSSLEISPSGVKISAPTVSIEGEATAELKSAMTTVNGSGVLTLKGGMVMIN